VREEVRREISPVLKMLPPCSGPESEDVDTNTNSALIPDPLYEILFDNNCPIAAEFFAALFKVPRAGQVRHE
jgi:hypothetical protein